MLIEMHCHTAEHSACSTVPAVDLVRRIFRKGLEGMIITDHHFLWPEEKLKALARNAGAPDYFLIFPGQELTTSDVGDILVYGAEEAIPRGTSVADVRKRYLQAALVLAHPYWDGKRPSEQTLLNPLFNAIEIFSSNHSVSANTRALRDWHRHKFTAVAGTDTHGATLAGTYPTLFDHPADTITELADELRKGRCRPYLDEVRRAGAEVRVDEVMIGRRRDGEGGEKIIIKEFRTRERWHTGERGLLVVKELARHGFNSGRYRIPALIEDDRENRIVVERSLEGKSLFEELTRRGGEDAELFIRLSGEWLAKLHNLRLQITPPGEFLPKEQGHLTRHVSRFEEIGHRHTQRARETMEAVWQAERALLADRIHEFVQGHGDFHPRNIYVCRDDPARPETMYIAAIDFDSSYCLPPAYDVATFLVQFRNQFLDFPEILEHPAEDIFLKAYMSVAETISADFLRQVELFRARMSLSIASFLIKMGLGESENLWRLLVEAERALIRFESNGS